MNTLTDRMIVWVEVGRGVVVEPDDVYWLDAEGAATWVRLRGRNRLRNRRSLGRVVEALAGFGFLRVQNQRPRPPARQGAVSFLRQALQDPQAALTLVGLSLGQIV